MKHKDTYGELIIACDDTNYWRRDIFPYYKYTRREDRDKSELDWNSIFISLNKIRDELKTFFPYKVIQVARAEADDIIGTLIHERYGKILGGEKVMILSGDKDFRQLQVYPNVNQYDPIHKKALKTTNAHLYLKEHIIRGDKGDGVPNFLSQDNSFAIKVRQKSIFDEKVKVWLSQEPEEFCDELMLTRWKRNESLVDLKKIPQDIKQEILNSYDSYKSVGRSRLFNYFMEYDLNNLLEAIGDF